MQEYGRTHDATAAALCFGNHSLNEDQRIAAACLREHPNDWSEAATCILEKKNNLPPATKDALSCGETSGSDPKTFAGCMIAKKLPEIPGDLGKFAKCYVMNQGAALATAACMVSDKLTPEQQIALQCASQSSDAATFAVCTSGQLTVREFVKCQDKKVGQGECFGENNEIRKFVRNVFNQDINDTTVVGQAMNVHLEVAKAQVALAETAGKTLEQVADGAAKVGQQLVDGATHVVTEVAKQAEQAKSGACNIVQCVGGVVPIAIPRVDVPVPQPITRTSNGTCIPWCPK